MFGLDVAPPVTAYDAAVDVQARSDRTHDRPPAVSTPASSARALQSRVVEGRAGRKLDRGAATAVVVRALAGLRSQPAGRAPARGGRAERQRRRARGSGDAGSHGPLGPVAARLRRDALAGAALANRARSSPCLPAAAPTSRSPGGGPRSTWNVSRHRVAQAAGRPVPGHGYRQDRDQAVGTGPAARHSRYREGDRRGRVLDRPPDREPRRPGRRAGAHDGDREDDGHHGRRRLLHDDLRRHAGAPEQRAARRGADRRHADRARRDVLVQRHDRASAPRSGASRRLP